MGFKNGILGKSKHENKYFILFYFCRQILFRTFLLILRQRKDRCSGCHFSASELSPSPLTKGQQGSLYFGPLAPFDNNFLEHTSPHCTYFLWLPPPADGTLSEWWVSFFPNAQYLDNVWHWAGIQWMFVEYTNECANKSVAVKHKIPGVGLIGFESWFSTGYWQNNNRLNLVPHLWNGNDNIIVLQWGKMTQMYAKCPAYSLIHNKSLFN